MKTKRILSLAIVSVMLFTMLASMSLSVSAASSKSYDCDVARTIIVKTGSGITKPSIRFTCKADREFGKRGISNYAPKMSLRIYDHKTGTVTWKRITGTGSSISSTLKLERNRTYTITVSYIYDKGVNYNAFCVGGGKAWAEGTWWIASTNKITSYSIK